MSLAFDPVPLRPRRRLDPASIVGIALVVLVAVALIKPWASATPPSGGSAAVSPTLAGTLDPILGPLASGSDERIVAVPTPGPSTAADRRSRLLATLVARLAPLAGAWGVGAGGVPRRPIDPMNSVRLMRSPWTTWSSVDPGRGQTPLRAATVASACGTSPSLPSLPSVVALTAPATENSDWRVIGEAWRDGRVTGLGTEVRQIAQSLSPGIFYLVRTDNHPWTPGFYRFTIVGPALLVTIDDCLVVNQT